MLRRGEDQQSPEGGGVTAVEEQRVALQEHLAADERIQYRFEATSPVVLDRDGEGERLGGSSGGSAVVALTDRGIYVDPGDSAAVDTIDYEDVRSVDASGRLLRSRLAIRVWNRGTYRVEVGRGADVAGAADFAERASETYQRVLAAIESARDSITALGKHVESGNREDRRTAKAAIRDDLMLARRRIEGGPDRIEGPLEDRVAEVVTELQRTRMRAHAARGSALVERGDRLTDREAWSDAVTAYVRAGDHLETAYDVATQRGFGTATAIETAAERLRNRVDRLSKLPLELAEDARVAAQDADDLEAAVPAWAATVEHYRAAITAGWGSPIDFAGDRETLRTRVEWAARKLIVARCQLARRLRDQGDDRRAAGADTAAADRYEAALSQVEAARSVARELRAGDLGAIEARRTVLLDRLRSVRGEGSAESSVAAPAAEELVENADTEVGEQVEDGGTDAGSRITDLQRGG